MGVLSALIGAGLFALVNVLVRLGGRRGSTEDGFLLTVVVNTVVFGSMLAVLSVVGSLPPLRPAGLAAFAGAGVATTFAGRWLLFAALRAIGPARTLSFKVSSPVFSIALAAAFLGEAVTAGLVLGTAAVGMGLWLLSREILRAERLRAVAGFAAPEASGALIAPPVAGGANGERQPDYRRGVGLALLSGLCFGTGHFLRKLGLLQIPSEVVGIALGTAMAFAGATSVRAVGQHRRRMARFRLHGLPWEFWASGALLSLAVFAQFAALRLAPVSRVSVIMASESLLTIAFAALFVRDERLTVGAVGSAVLVFGGVALVVLR